MIYEGTNGIQAMDLLGRKLAMNKGQSFTYFLDQIRKTILEAQMIDGLSVLAEKVEVALDRYDTVAYEISARARSEKALNAYAFAHPFLDITGDVVFAWMHLWRACVAAPKLAKKVGSLEPEAVAAKAAKNKNVAFYAGQMASARFFINTLLPGCYGKMDAILEGDTCVEDIQDVSFGSK
jgi:hypothetical protein